MPSRAPNDTEDYNGLKRRVQHDIGLVARAAKLRPPSRLPVVIEFWWHEPDRRRDPDNVRAGGTKLILDAFGPPRKNGGGGIGLLATDGPRGVAGFAGDSFIYPGNDEYRGPGVLVQFGPGDTDDWVCERTLWLPFRLPDHNELGAAREYGARKHAYRNGRAKGANQWR